MIGPRIRKRLCQAMMSGDRLELKMYRESFVVTQCVFRACRDTQRNWKTVGLEWWQELRSRWPDTADPDLIERWNQDTLSLYDFNRP